MTLCNDTKMLGLIRIGLLSLIICLLNCPHANSDYVETATMKEMAVIMVSFSQLPEYCQVRLAEREIVWVRKQKLPKQFERLRDKWKRKIGPTWASFHHYSWGIKRYQDALRRKKGDPLRTSTLKWALDEFAFHRRVVKKRGSFPLWSTHLQYEYKIHMELGQFDLAQKKLRELTIYNKRLKRKK